MKLAQLHRRSNGRSAELVRIAQPIACCGEDGVNCRRFDGHRDWVFHEGGGGDEETEVQPQVQVEVVKLVRELGVSVAQASRDLDVHENGLRR